MTTRIVIAISLLCCVALCINLDAQSGGDVADQIKQLQQESRNAQMKNDASWAQQHLADGFVAGNSWGDWETKEGFIKDLQNKTNKWKSGNISDVKVATFGPNAPCRITRSPTMPNSRASTGREPLSAATPGSMIPAHGKRLRPTARW